MTARHGFERWYAPADPERASLEFSELRSFATHATNVPAIEYRPVHQAPTWRQTRELWLALPRHPHVLAPLALTEHGVLLEFAALDWAGIDKLHPSRSWTSSDVLALARRGLQITDAFAHCFATVEPKRWRLLSQPFLFADLDGGMRIGFRPVTSSPGALVPDIRLDQRSLVWLIGNLLESRGPLPSEILERCADRHPGERYQTLEELRQTWISSGADPRVVRTGDEGRRWTHIEAAVGWCLLGERAKALAELDSACSISPPSPLAALGRDHVRDKLGLPALGGDDDDDDDREYDLLDWGRFKKWSDIEPLIASHETAHEYGEALSLYQRVAITRRVAGVVHARWAHCSLLANQPAAAVEHAREALATEPGRLDARAALAKALVAVGAFTEGHAEAQAWQRAAPLDPIPQYVLAKAAIGLGRLPEARAHFDRAVALGPSTEAVVLRAQLARVVGALQRDVGVQHTTLALPASLASIRTVLERGKPLEIIGVLASPTYADNTDAQLILAQCMSDVGDLEAALDVLTRLEQTDHRHEAVVAKGRTLLAHERLESALAVLDVACGESQADAEAFELRARTLEKLGRFGEAAADFRRFVALATGRTDVRVKAAQDWLETH